MVPLIPKAKTPFAGWGKRKMVKRRWAPAARQTVVWDREKLTSKRMGIVEGTSFMPVRKKKSLHR